MRWWCSILLVCACDSNPTPHPSRQDDVIGAEVGGNPETDPDDMADSYNPAAEPDAFDPSDKGDTNGLAGDVGDAADDANETTVSDVTEIEAD